MMNFYCVFIVLCSFYSIHAATDDSPCFFMCTDKRSCASESQVCDHHKDCFDNSDEGGQCNDGGCKNMVCKGGRCKHTPTGARCICEPGYKIQQSTSPKTHGEKNYECVDIDECKLAGTCSHTCTNTAGGFTCSCSAGYQLDNERKCKSLQEKVNLIYSSGDDIKSLDMRTGDETEISSEAHSLMGLAYDPIDDVLYWLERSHGHSTLYRRRKNDAPEAVIQIGVTSPSGLSIDWISRLLYITDSREKMVVVCHAQSLECAVLFNTSQSPKDIIVLPRREILVWIELGINNCTIMTAQQDGTNPQVVRSGLALPRGLAVDEINNRLYWLDEKEMVIQSTDLYGNDFQILKINLRYAPVSLQVFEDEVYWSDIEQIRAVNQWSGKDERTVVSSSFVFPGQFIIPQFVKSWEEVNPCFGNPCSGICVPSVRQPQQYVCKCPQGMTQNGRLCSVPRNETYVLVTKGTSIYSWMPSKMSHSMEKLGTVQEAPIGVAHDPVTDLLFTNSRKQLTAYYVDGKAFSEGPIKVETRVTSMCIDVPHGNLYWVNNELGMVNILPLNRISLQHSSKVIVNNLDFPSYIVVSPLHRRFFLVAGFSTPHIASFSLDGSDQYVLVEAGLGEPVALALDYSKHRIYWADRETDAIESVLMDGSGRRKFKMYLGTLSGLVAQDGNIYWTTTDMGQLAWADVDKKLTRKVMLGMDSAISYGHHKEEIHLSVLHTLTEKRLSECTHTCEFICYGMKDNALYCDCPDGMELTGVGSCRTVTCPRYMTSCPDGACIRTDQKCDGISDCASGWDEVGCVPSCNPPNVKCGSGACVHAVSKCDGIKDCADGEDEQNCPRPDCEHEFQCLKSGKCIPMDLVCDTHADCEDGSDEASSICTMRICPHDLFRCSSGQCIEKSWKCDGEPDCKDASDEIMCFGFCKSSEYECSDGRCIPAAAVCDGHRDCADNGEEDSCEAEVLYVACADDMWACDSQTCIPEMQRCDGKFDCSDGGDESDCPELVTLDMTKGTTENINCPSCMPSSACYAECVGDDRKRFPWCPKLLKDLEEPCTGTSGFKCARGNCLALKDACDKIQDCVDNSDEDRLCDSACDNNGGCMHICHPTPRGPVCSCQDGFKLSSDNRTCDDINECDDDHYYCSQKCFNIRGSAHCSCVNGYTLGVDQRTCKATDENPGLLLTEAHAVIHTNLQNHKSHELSGEKKLVQQHHTSSSLFVGVDYDIAAHKVYWSEDVKQVIYSLDTISNEIEPVMFLDGNPLAISVDWITKNLYFIKYKQDIFSVEACVPDKNMCAVVVPPTEDMLIGLPLDPLEGLMFWIRRTAVNSTTPSAVMRGNMDGSDKTVLVSQLSRPTGIAIDHIKHVVLWVDSCLSVIRATDYMGSHVHTIYAWNEHIDFPYTLAVFESHFYMSAPNTYSGQNGISVQQCKFTDTTTCRTVKTSPNLIYSLAIEHPLKQLKKENPCATDCDHICLLSPSGVSCIHNALAMTDSDMDPGAAVGIAFLVIVLSLVFVGIWYMRYKKIDYVKRVKGFNIKFTRKPQFGILRSDTVTSQMPSTPPKPKRRTISYSNPSYEEYVDANANIQKELDIEDAFQCKVSMDNEGRETNMKTRLV